jgi:hypothetical protein
MARRLKELVIQEVSSVGKGANEHARILLMKGAAGMTPEDALSASIASCLDDEDLVDKAGWIAQQVKDYRAHVGVTKGAEIMDRDIENLTVFAKMAISQGRSLGLRKADFIAGVRKRAAAIRRDGESDAAAFTRAMTDDEIGKTLWRASKVAPGPEIEGDARQDFVPRKPSDMGPAHAQMQVLADDHLKANPRKTPASAYAAVYAHPDNAALREKCKAEHFAAISKAAA